MLQLRVFFSTYAAVSLFSFRIVICRGFRAIHGNAQREQRYEQFANSLSETRTRQAVWAAKLASWSVSILFFVPSLRAFHRTLSLGETCRLVLFFFIFTSNVYLTARYTPPRIFSLSTSGLSVNQSCTFPSHIHALSFSRARYTTDRHETAKCRQLQVRNQTKEKRERGGKS